MKAIPHAPLVTALLAGTVLAATFDMGVLADEVQAMKADGTLHWQEVELLEEQMQRVIHLGNVYEALMTVLLPARWMPLTAAVPSAN